MIYTTVRGEVPQFRLHCVTTVITLDLIMALVLFVRVRVHGKDKFNVCDCLSSPEYHPHYVQFTGVSRCWDVVHLHRLLWSSVVLNVLGVFLGIVTAAILGAFKDMVRLQSEQITL